MRYLVLLITLAFSSLTFSGPEMHTNNNFGHALLPPFDSADHEEFLSGCENNISQNADGTGSGSYICKRKYPAGALPITEDYEITGAEVGIACDMTDSNNTTYTTQDNWNAEYKVDLEGFNKAFGGKYKKKYDCNGDGYVNAVDLGCLEVEVKYTLTCRDGEQQ